MHLAHVCVMLRKVSGDPTYMFAFGKRLQVETSYMTSLCSMRELAADQAPAQE
jgi:hypothetical protein